MVLDHPGNLQVLNNNGPELPGQGRGELVDAIHALVGDLPCALPKAATAPRQRFDGTRRCLVALS
jgi:hypothetical protein